MVAIDGQEQDNPTIPAGYTYLGQFIDHDITFDPSSSLQRMNDPEGLVNFRTPRFDLDSLYGSGPDDDPFMYDEASDGVKLLVGKVRQGERETNEDDLPRNQQGRALIGDPRNDENTIVSQLHLAFVKFHNAVVDHVQEQRQQAGREPLSRDDLFKEAQRLVRWHYQWVVVNDFLKRIVGADMLNELFHPGADGAPHTITNRFYRWKVQPFMPVEFSAAAYRFGHSQVRSTYTINSIVPPLPIFSASPNAGLLDDFRGFRSLPAKWTVDWTQFYDIDRNAPPQASLKIDTHLSRALNTLPAAPTDDLKSLARRNLFRGWRLGLPSGRRIASTIGEVPLNREELGFEAVGYDGPSPLWYYILKEAEIRANGEHLGPVGGRIVAEVLLGLLKGDPLSFINVEPGWRPTLPAATPNEFTMPDLLRFAVPAQTVRR
ncbi:MAG: heme peroxidase family protein [Chloroflexota bacterium]|nr:heme peroxidase family protein [Chloroflexota bacterium]